MKTHNLNWFLYIIGWYKYKWERERKITGNDAGYKMQDASRTSYGKRNMGTTNNPRSGITGYISARMINIRKCPVYEEDTDDITFLTDKLIAEGLTKKEREELDFLRELSSL